MNAEFTQAELLVISNLARIRADEVACASEAKLNGDSTYRKESWLDDVDYALRLRIISSKAVHSLDIGD